MPIIILFTFHMTTDALTDKDKQSMRDDLIAAVLLLEESNSLIRYTELRDLDGITMPITDRYVSEDDT